MKLGKLNSLRVQIALFYSVASLVMFLLIGFLLYYSISNIVLEDALETTTLAVDRSGAFIEEYIDRNKDLSLLLAKDPALLRYLSGETVGNEAKDVLASIDTVMAADPYISSIIIVGKEGQLLSNEAVLDMSMSDDMMKEAWYEAVVYGDGMPALTSARMQNFNMDKDHWVISLSREIQDADGAHLGVVVVDFKYSIIESYLEGLNLGSEGYVFILNAQGGVVYHEDPVYFQNPNLQAQLMTVSEKTVGYESDMNRLIHSCGIPGTDWRMYGIASLDGLSAIRRQLLETIGLATLASLVALTILGTMVAGRITNPIKDLENAMNGIEAGLAMVEVDGRGCNEAISLAQHYNYMIDRVRALMEDIATKEQAIRAYELNVLHSQINPHFLYNTLDTIVWMAEFGDSEKVIHITKALAKFFRLSLSGGSETTTIANEVEHVRQYLVIQKERYDEQLNYTIDMAEGFEEVTIPKIVLQPIVENSIYHGIRDLDSPGHIDIAVTEDGEDICFTVKDDGKGFDPEAVGQKDSTEKVKLGGVGIRNVDQRLKLTYGDDYGLTIESAPGKGTEVTVRVKRV